MPHSFFLSFFTHLLLALLPPPLPLVLLLFPSSILHLHLSHKLQRLPLLLPMHNRKLLRVLHTLI